jgi:hypothetical protein
MCQIPVWVRPLKWVGKWIPGAKEQTGVVRETPDAQALDALLAQTPPPERSNSIARSGEWLHWRYNPLGIRHFDEVSPRRYHWHALYDSAGEMRAYCVWGVLACNDATLCEWHGMDAAAKQAVLQDAIALAQTNGQRLFRAYRKLAEPNHTLWKHGFVRLPAYFGARFIVRHLTANNPGGCIQRFDRWQIIGGDMDTQ